MCSTMLQEVANAAIHAGVFLRVPKGFVSVNDLADRYGVHRTTIFRLLKKKKVKPKKFFNFRLVSEKDVEKLMGG